MSDLLLLNPGDTVRLKSGGPVMTVNERVSGGGLLCLWFAGNEVKHHTFRAETLELCPPPAGMTSATTERAPAM